MSETLAPFTVNENTASLALSNYVTVTDSPNTSDALSTVLTVTQGTITAGGHTGASVTLTGTAAAIETALASATYTGGTNYYGPDTLTVATTDTLTTPRSARRRRSRLWTRRRCRKPWRRSR